MSIEAARSYPLACGGPETLGAEWRDYVASLYRASPLLACDSVVVAGADIAALTFAARLARSSGFGGRVVVVAPPRRRTRQLIAPVGLHDRALADICEATGCNPAYLLRAAGHGRRSGHVLPGAPSSAVHGIRLDAMEAVLRSLTEGMGVLHLSDRPTGIRHLRAMARGARPLLVNATGNPCLLGAAASAPRRHLVWVQAAFRDRRGGTLTPLPAPGRMSGLRARRAARCCSFLPLADAQSPAATVCGRIWRVARGGLPAAWPDVEDLAESLFAVADAHGLLPEAPVATLGWQVMPLPLARMPDMAEADIFELRRVCDAAAPRHQIDGQSAANVGLRSAVAVLRGEPPDRGAAEALRHLRWRFMRRRKGGPDPVIGVWPQGAAAPPVPGHDGPRMTDQPVRLVPRQ